MVTGWAQVGGTWYLLSGSGAMETGWSLLQGSWFYLEPGSGAMAEGWRQVDGEWYRFGAGGRLMPGLPLSDLQASADAVGSGWYPASSSGAVSQTSLDRISEDMLSIWNDGHDVAFALVDLTTGETVSANARKAFFGASTIKGPYSVSCAYGWPSKAPAWSGTFYDALVWSNNGSYASLRSAFGSGVFRRFLDEAGLPSVSATNSYPYYSAADLAKMWLRNYEYFANRQANSEWLVGDFFHTDTSVVDAALGSYRTVVSKPGWMWEWWEGNIQNDGAIVIKGDRPYVLAIMSSVYPGDAKLRQLVWDIDAAHSELVGW